MFSGGEKNFLFCHTFYRQQQHRDFSGKPRFVCSYKGLSLMLSGGVKQLHRFLIHLKRKTSRIFSENRTPRRLASVLNSIC